MLMRNNLYEIIEPQIPNAIQVADATSAGVGIAGFPQKHQAKAAVS